jgi:hypothetical protein
MTIISSALNNQPWVQFLRFPLTPAVGLLRLRNHLQIQVHVAATIASTMLDSLGGFLA